MTTMTEPDTEVRFEQCGWRYVGISPVPPRFIDVDDPRGPADPESWEPVYIRGGNA